MKIILSHLLSALAQWFQTFYLMACLWLGWRTISQSEGPMEIVINGQPLAFANWLLAYPAFFMLFAVAALFASVLCLVSAKKLKENTK